MVAPYTSSRTGRFAWMMQRASAVLLIILAFSHFIIQHFTSDAVSTALTVSQRLNNPLWQAYYVMFIVLALYHGTNGVLGIIHDYAPKPLVRGIAALLLWSLALVFAIIGIVNIVHPKPVAEVKIYYTIEGLPKGKSSGSPPVPIDFPEYDARSGVRELNFLAFYLQHHTFRNEENPSTVGEAFNNKLNASDFEQDVKAQQSGIAFDTWALAIANGESVTVKDRNRHYIFSNTREYAIWALQLRLRNAEKRGDTETLARLKDKVPAYNPELF